ncbi:amidohydrolase family protein [uncultured Jatrophihabitans sp.]|uniref:amidohydrolase family protein n=1 Tax=uncultured Jatrophihabitans sp. TaxID=1610747 RepID=UPI0035C9E5E1
MTQVNDASAERALLVSSDGHATALMRDYAPYIDPKLRPEFEEFCTVFDEKGMTTIDPRSLAQRIDPDLIADWIEMVVEPGRLAGQYDPERRLKELDHEGISGEIIFPDFGLPWELHPPLVAAILGYRRTPEQIEAANKAYNRWLVDFCSTSSGRLGGLAVMSFADIDDTIKEIYWAKENGLVGVVLPSFSEDKPLFHKDYDPVWSALEETALPACTHTAISSITDRISAATLQAVPHPACAAPILTAQVFFFTQQILGHALWGGVLERHPNLHLVLTEQGSGWVIGAVRGWDYSWGQSYLRRDVREIVKERPSFYFERQIHMGSSLLSRAEAAAREEIGVHKMLIGSDYPHHEGTWGAGPGTTEYMQATLGAAHVPPEHARQMLGANAIETFHLDGAALRRTADDIGTPLSTLLQEPTKEWFPRGDVHKPLLSAW